MAQRRFHYEQAFEQYLRANGLPYVAVDEARKALDAGGRPHGLRPPEEIPAPSDTSDTPEARHRTDAPSPAPLAPPTPLPPPTPPIPLKSFDFIVYTPDRNLLIDIKGRHVRGRLRPGRRLENWVTREDVDCMLRWESLFGSGFVAVFVFAYGFDMQPPDGWFEEVIVGAAATSAGRAAPANRRRPASGSPRHAQRWYALEEVCVSTYRRHMTNRSGRWSTVEVPQPVMRRLVQPLRLRPDWAAGYPGSRIESRPPSGCSRRRPAVCSTG